MNWKRFLGILVVAVLIGIVAWKLKTNKELTTSKVYQYDKNATLFVDVDTVMLKNIENVLTYSGVFEPDRETKLSAESQGKINSVLVDVGDIVRTGETLIRLDNSLLALQLQAIDVQIEGLRADVERYTVLSKADAIQGVQLEKAILGLKATTLQKTILQEQIAKTVIKAPFNGIVTAKMSEVGSFAAPGVPLLQITDISSVRFTVNVPEQDLSKFKLNQTHRVTVDAVSNQEFEGKITLISSKANIGSSFPIQLKIKNTHDSVIKAGMFGKLIIKNENQQQGFIVPTSAITGTTDQASIYKVVDGKAVTQIITISEKIDNKAIVTKGLSAGDVVVVGGLINLFEGANVSVKK